MTSDLKESRNRLVNFLLRDPLGFNQKHCVEDLAEIVEFKHLRSIVKRIYDLNENQLIEESNANTGSLGWAKQKKSET